MKQVGLILIFLTVLKFSEAQKPQIQKQQEQILSSLSIEEKLGQLLVLKSCASKDPEEIAEFYKIVKGVQPGAVYFEGGKSDDINTGMSRLNKIGAFPILYISNLSHSNINLLNLKTLASVTNENLILELGQLMGIELNRLGIDMVIDPAFSLLSNEYRYYGNLLAGGIINEGLNPIYYGEPGLIKNKTSGVFFIEGTDPVFKKKTAHYEALTSFKLRNEGFEGIIIAHADYPHSTLTEPEQILHQLLAGADMIFNPNNVEELIRFLAKQVKTERFPEQLLNEKVSRILKNKYEKDKEIQVAVTEKEKTELKNDLLLSAISLNKNLKDLIPFRMLDTLELAYMPTGGINDQLETYLKKFTSIVTMSPEFENIKRLASYDLVVVPITSETTTEELRLLQSLTTKVKVLAIGIGGIPLTDLVDMDYVVSVPEVGEDTYKYLPQLLFGSYAFEGSYSTAMIPTGFERGIKTKTLSRLGYSDPDKVGMCATTLEGIDQIALEAINKGATPGMQVLVARKGKVIFEKSYGYYTYEQDQLVTNETLYDLASVTKVTATLQAVTFMAENQLIDLNSKISKYLPELRGTNKEDLVIKDILLHQAGLRPWMPFWQQSMSDEKSRTDLYSEQPEEEFPLQVSMGLYANEALKDSVWHWIIESKLIKTKPGKAFEYRYSDMGFYIMQQLAERILNQPLNDFVDQNFYSPMGMTTTGYLPLCKFSIEDIAPTAEDPYFRKQLIKGVVHDEGAAMFGGVAGHSGLFSDANDLAKIFQMYLQGGVYGGYRYFNKETLDYFTKKQIETNRRGLGWDKPDFSGEGSVAKAGVSSKTFGHTGFTGTAVWVDPEYDLIYIFLSNRIHPDAENGKLMSLNIRSRIQELIYNSISDFNNTLLLTEETQ